MSKSLIQLHAREEANPSRSVLVSNAPMLRRLRNAMAVLSLLAAGAVPFAVTAAEADAAPSSAKSQSPITVSLKQLKVTQDERGEAKFSDAAVVMPGDVIEYRATYINRGSSTLPVVATLPIPESMEYIKDSAQASKKLAYTVAQKDLQYSTEPLVKKVTSTNGVTLSQPIPYAAYRYVRWDLGKLVPGNPVEVSVRAMVAQNPEANTRGLDKASVAASASSLTQ